MKKRIMIVVLFVAAMMTPSAAIASPIQPCEGEQSNLSTNSSYTMSWDSWEEWFKHLWG